MKETEENPGEGGCKVKKKGAASITKKSLNSRRRKKRLEPTKKVKNVGEVCEKPDHRIMLHLKWEDRKVERN